MNTPLQRRLRHFVFLFAALFGGCTVAPIGDSLGEIRKSTTIPEAWMFASANAAAESGRDWWRNFHDAELDRLVDLALRHNQDLAAAGYVLRKALLGVDQTALESGPTVSGSANATQNRDFTNRTQNNAYALRLSASYQLDLWRKLATDRKIAAWKAEASAEDLLATRLSLIGAVVDGYLDMLYNEERLALNDKQHRSEEQIRDMVRARYRAGGASRLDLVNAEQNLTALEETKNTLQTACEQARNRLSLLLGGAPQRLHLESRSLKTLALPEIATGIPAAILHQRPDLRAAHYRLQADLGTVQVDTLAFYPNFSLTGKLATSSERLLEILRHPVASLAGTITLPFLDYRTHTLTLKSSRLQYQANLATFRQTLYRAFADVENALLDLRQSEENAAILERRIAEAKETERLNAIRYRAGASSRKDLLDARQARYAVESSLLENRYQRLARRVALYLALGGNRESLPQRNANASLPVQ